MITRFEELLQELGAIVQEPLHVDKLGGCALLIDEKLQVQIGLDRTQEKIIFSAYVASITAGRFRENVLIEALKENNTSNIGTFGYSPYHDMLALFSITPIEGLEGEKLANTLATFTGVAMAWKNAIDAGFTRPASKLDKLPPPTR